MVQTSEGEMVSLDGYPVATMKKEMTWLGILAAGYNMSNSWLVFSVTMIISLIYGPMVTLWTLICIPVIYFFIGITLAELISAYPTTGGQYHWASLLAPKAVNRQVSYFTGFFNWFSWLAMAASSQGAVCQCVYALIYNANPNFVAHPWQSFLLFQSMNVLSLVANLFGHRGLPKFYTFGFVLSLASFFTIMITCLARAEQKQDSSFVWLNYVETSGWPTGVEFLIALTAPIIVFCPINGCVHLVDEVINAPVVVPKTILSALVISFVTTFAFALSMLYCLTDMGAVLSNANGLPLFEIWLQATRSNACSIVFTVLILLMLPFGSIACTQVASMMTMSLGRDKGLAFSSHLSKINPKLRVPVWSVLLNFGVMFLIGVLYLISSLAFNATIGVAAIFQQVTISVPPLLLLIRGRSEDMLPSTRTFRVPNWLGYICNAGTVLIGLVTFVFFQFPATAPVSDPTDMNYACAVEGVVGLVALGNWFFYARHRYQGPSAIELHH
ncbi:hypothetical protein P175DRAFT_0476570 [Aspergillus ochraceoroseus IBT 24754]|nr:uncharacterized protein P175DRAFT_0476570 [Aspergillus ochraceoroseus IBT 24754]PTU21449.1 hypothetical protein P175DRAFT_0476570 [Aspergillus ochraceoroseus IBT 24754]